MHKKSTSNSILMGFIIAIAIVAVMPLQASARGVQTLAEAGRAVSSSDQSCFTLSYGAVTNTCSTTRNYEVVLPMSGNGTLSNTFVMVGNPSSSNLVNCKLTTLDYAFDPDSIKHTSWTTSGFSGSTWDILYLPSISVSPAYGVAFLTCQIPSGGKLGTIIYDDLGD
jgi:hypothetical protein